MNAKHTKEPWRVSGTGHLCSGKTVIPYDDLKQDARRIVACVNACNGISTEDIEQRGVVITPKNEMPALTLKYRQALKRIADMTDRDGNQIEMHIEELRGIARAAIESGKVPT